MSQGLQALEGLVEPRGATFRPPGASGRGGKHRGEDTGPAPRSRRSPGCRDALRLSPAWPAGQNGSAAFLGSVEETPEKKTAERNPVRRPGPTGARSRAHLPSEGLHARPVLVPARLRNGTRTVRAATQSRAATGTQAASVQGAGGAPAPSPLRVGLRTLKNSARGTAQQRTNSRSVRRRPCSLVWLPRHCPPRWAAPEQPRATHLRRSPTINPGSR